MDDHTHKVQAGEALQKIRELSRFVVVSLNFPTLPALAQSASAGLVFLLGVHGAQVVGHKLRVSCVTPYAPLLGALAVGTSSILAGQTASLVQRRMSGEGWLPPRFDVSEMLFHGVVGMAVFKLTNGSFRNLMPSDLRHPGALAKGSIPARSSSYANQTEREILEEMYKKYGCHHCGSRKHAFHADHMPPNKIVQNSTSLATEAWTVDQTSTSLLISSSPSSGGRALRQRAGRQEISQHSIQEWACSRWLQHHASRNARSAAATRTTGSKGAAGDARSAALSGQSTAKGASIRGRASSSSSANTGGNGGIAVAGTAKRSMQTQAGSSNGNGGGGAGAGSVVQQRFYPQCVNCSNLQSHAVKSNQQRLVLHWARGFPEASKWTGFYMGLLAVAVPPGPSQADDRPRTSPRGRTIFASVSQDEFLGPDGTTPSRSRRGGKRASRTNGEDALEDTQRLRADLTSNAGRRVAMMEAEIRGIRQHEALIQNEVAQRWAQRDNPMYKYKPNGWSKGSPSVEQLQKTLTELARQKGQLKNNVKWLKQHAQ
eukprot:jgi/Mesen1/10551/ME000083S10056